jgi:hypothetical protein
LSGLSCGRTGGPSRRPCRCSGRVRPVVEDTPRVLGCRMELSRGAQQEGRSAKRAAHIARHAAGAPQTAHRAWLLLTCSGAQVKLDRMPIEEAVGPWSFEPVGPPSHPRPALSPRKRCNCCYKLCQAYKSLQVRLQS